jgi:hypothetical protein
MVQEIELLSDKAVEHLRNSNSVLS